MQYELGIKAAKIVKLVSHLMICINIEDKFCMKNNYIRYYFLTRRYCENFLQDATNRGFTATTLSYGQVGFQALPGAFHSSSGGKYIDTSAIFVGKGSQGNLQFFFLVYRLLEGALC